MQELSPSALINNIFQRFRSCGRLLATYLALALLFMPLGFLFSSVKEGAASVLDTQISSGRQISLTLDQAVDMALKNNRRLKEFGYSAEGRRISLDAARDIFDIKIEPLSSINYTRKEDDEVKVWEVGGTVSKKFESGIEVALKPSIGEGSDEYEADVGLSVAVPLAKGFGFESVRDNLHLRKHDLATAARAFHQQRVATVLETVSAVYSSLREQLLIDLYREQLKLLRSHLRLAQIKKRIGLARNMDVYRVEIRIKEVEDTLNLAQERSENALDALKTILALPLDLKLEVDAPMEYNFVVLKPSEAAALALKKRVEIVQGKADILEAERRARVAQLNTRPEVDLKASYTRHGSSSELDDLFLLDEDVFRVGLHGSTDLSRSNEKAAWAQSKIDVKRQRLLLTTREENIVRQVRQTLNALKKSEERIQLRREQIVQAAGKQKIAAIKFRHGRADNFELIESQAQLQNAKANLLKDEIQYIISGYRLRANLGTLIEYNDI